MSFQNGKRQADFPGINLIARNRVSDAVIRFDQVSSAPTTTSGHRYLYVDTSNRLTYDNGSATTILGAAGAAATTWDGLYANDVTMTISGTGMTWTTTAAVDALTLDKTNTGAGVGLTLLNAGTGDDLQLTTTRATATGVVIETHHDSATPADNDVLLELQVHGDDDGGTETEYARLRFRSTDVTNATEDADFALQLMVAGSASDCLTVAGPTVTIGDGTSNATLTSSGALDLILSTNAGTNSGTIRIYDGVNGNIEVLPDGTGDLTVPTSGIVLGGTTPTRCSFSVGGTTGDGFLITTSSITSGDVLAVDHTANATLNGGNLLNLLVDSSSVFAVGETGAVTIAGSGGNTIFTASAGDLVVSDGSLAITDADDAATFTVTNNTATSASVVVLAGSGAFTGSTTTSWMTITPSGLTSGTAVYLAMAGLNSGKGIHVVGNALTTGEMVHLSHTTSVIADGGSMLRISSTSIDTGGATNGTLLDLSSTSQVEGSLVKLVAGAVTTGVLVDLSSTTGMTSGSLIRATTSTAGAVATNGIISFRATGAYTSTANAGLLDVQADALVGTGTIVNIKATNGSQLTNTALNVEQTTTTTGYTGDFVRIVGTSTTGDSNLIAVTCASTSAGDALQITGNGLVAGTSTLVNLVHGTSVLGAGNSMLRITSTGVDTGTTTGTLLDLAATAATSATLVLLTSATLDSGKGVSMVVNGLTTGEAFHISHTTSVIADGGSLMRLQSSSVDTGGATNGTVLDLIGSGQLAGVAVLGTFAAMTTGTVARFVANALTSGIMLDLETSAAGFTGSYIRCYDGAAVDFSVGADGAVVQNSGLNTTVYALTADTATTLGAGANDGVVNLSADGLTTGTALNIGLTEGTLTTGRYIKCWDVTGAVEVMSVEEDGEITIAGGRATTAGGADAINIGVSAAIKIAWGSGAPTYTAPQGSLYMRTDGSSTSTRLYVNTDGAGTWTNVTTAA